MDEHSAWNGWLLRHGRLADALFTGLLWIGMLPLPHAVYWLLGVPGNWGQVLIITIGSGAGAIVGRALGRIGQPARRPNMPATVSSRRKRGCSRSAVAPVRAWSQPCSGRCC